MKAFWQWIKADFQNRVLAGMLVIVPIAATFVVLRVVFKWVDELGAAFIRHFFHIDFLGLGILLTLLVVYLSGLFATNVIGKQIVHWLESAVLGRLPIIKDFYRAFKKLLIAISLPGSQSFKRVVLVEFPRPGVKSVGFVTGGTFEPGSGKRLVNVFIPTVPNPTSGLLELVPEERIIDTDLSIEEGIRIVVSGGFLNVERLPSR